MRMHPDIPSESLLIDAATRHVVGARNHLQAAVYKFDDAGFEHGGVARAYSFVAGLVAEFNGRPAGPQAAVPAYVEEAAKEWRRAGKRGY